VSELGKTSIAEYQVPERRRHAVLEDKLHCEVEGCESEVRHSELMRRCRGQGSRVMPE